MLHIHTAVSQLDAVLDANEGGPYVIFGKVEHRTSNKRIVRCSTFWVLCKFTKYHTHRHTQSTVVAVQIGSCDSPVCGATLTPHPQAHRRAFTPENVLRNGLAGAAALLLPCGCDSKPRPCDFASQRNGPACKCVALGSIETSRSLDVHTFLWLCSTVASISVARSPSLSWRVNMCARGSRCRRGSSFTSVSPINFADSPGTVILALGFRVFCERC